MNECQINNHDCSETQRCDNTIGSYTCIRLQSCGTGYTLNAGTGHCDDDDECILNRHNCVAPYECRNTKGSFRCDRPRYTTTTPPPTTTTLKTTTTPRPYIHTHVYSSTPKRYTITAPYGRYTAPPVPASTSPIPNRFSEWDTRFGPCNAGFQRSNQGACVDVDECYVSNPCRRNQRCQNTNGSYKCVNLLTCSGGFTSNEEGSQCIGRLQLIIILIELSWLCISPHFRYWRMWDAHCQLWSRWDLPQQTRRLHLFMSHRTHFECSASMRRHQRMRVLSRTGIYYFAPLQWALGMWSRV